MKIYIEKCIQTMINEYKNNHKRIHSDYNREREAIDVYKGRELLELIQNADDELLEDMGKEIKLSFCNDVLTVSNNGSPFSEEGIDSLMYSHISSKSQKKDVIGNKGTGFRAILGWANEIMIRSGELSIRFSDGYAQSVLNDILKSSDNVKSGKKYQSATLAFPEWIVTETNSTYTTDISIHIRNDQSIINDINKQLNDIDGELLLFLNRAEELIVETKGRKVSFKKSSLDDDRILIQKYTDGILENKQEWLMNRQNGEFEGKHFSIVIAYNSEGLRQKKQVIYSYFPTDIEFPFPVLLHANFNLNSDRNHLTKANKANQHILEQACKLLINTSLKLTREEVSYAALLVLAPQSKIPKELIDYEFDKILTEEIRYSRVFPTVNAEYISFDKTPKFYTSYLSQYLEGEGFNDLLIHTENRTVLNLILKLNNNQYPAYAFDDIVKKINKWAKAHAPEKSALEMHAHCAIGFLESYPRLGDDKSRKKMPLLIYDTDNKLVSNENAVFLSDRNSNVSNPPGFAQIRFIHPEMRNIFEELTKTSGRNLAIKLNSFGVREYNTARIIEKMNGVIKRRMDTDKAPLAKRFCESEIKWIWKNRHILDNIGEKIKIYLITRNGDVRLSDDLYMGKEYGNLICENLFSSLLEDKFADDIQKYIETKESSNQEIVNFLMTLGVDIFPKQKNKKISPDRDYKSKLLGGLYFPYTFNETTFKNLDDMILRVSNMTADVTMIGELEYILKNCDTQSILEWIKADSILAQMLFTRKEIGNSRVNIIWDYKQNTRSLPMEKVYSYVYWMFETIPWIKIGNKRYNMSECLLSKIGNLLEPLLLEPEIDVYIKDIEGSKARLRNDYEYLFGRLGVENDFAELSIDKIYEVLNFIPEINEGENIAKRFYTALVKSDRIISDDELKCQPFEQFIESGKVLCNSGYQRIQDSWYLDGKNICEKIANAYNLIELTKRQSSIKIKRLLGVEKLTLKGELVGSPEIHPENMIFQRDFKTYKPMAFCYRIDHATKDETKRFSDLDIILCTNLKARYTDKEIELDDYDFILKDAKVFYLKIPKTLKSLDEMKRNVSFAAAIANVLCSFIDVSESFASFRELYGANDSSRKELIQQIFEDDEILERAKIELNYSVDTKEEFIRIVANCSGADLLTVVELAIDIDYDNFSAVSNAKTIINCFRQLGIDIEEYNEALPSTPIDLYNYYMSELTKLLPQYYSVYKSYHYHRLKAKSLEEKKKLVDLFLNYENRKPKIINSVYYNYETELISHLEIQKDVKIVDLVSLYNSNSSIWEKSMQNTEYVEEFLTKPSNMSLVYYEEYIELNKAYEEFLHSQLTNNEVLDDAREEFIEPEVLHPTTIPAPQNVTLNGEKVKNSTGFTKTRNLEKIGLKGEKIVFEMLKKQYSLTKWVSENGKAEGINPEGRSGLGYDIEFVDESGNRKYIEVKASKTNEIVFYMSDNEFNFAIKNISEYCLYYVSDVLSKKPKILIFENLFKGNDFNFENYALDTRKEYKIMATIK